MSIRLSFVKIVLVLCVFCVGVFAQGVKPKIALYIASDKLSIAEQRVLTNKFLDPFTASGKYSVIDRSDVFLQQATRERIKQRDGSVDNSQILAIGKEYGARYVCIIGLEKALDGYGYNISARLVDVVTAEVYLKTGQTDVSSLRGFEIDRVAEVIFNKIHDGTQTAVTSAFASTGRTFTDKRDGKTYRMEKIGHKTWMAENLNYQIGNSWCYENVPSNCNKYGRLYDWDTAVRACPAGWSLPTREDWNGLVARVGDSSASTKLKSKSPSWNGTDDLGFSALPSGGRSIYGSFYSLGLWGHWWTATERYYGGAAYYRYIGTDNASVNEDIHSTSRGFSVRCVQD